MHTSLIFSTNYRPLAAYPQCTLSRQLAQPPALATVLTETGNR